MKKKILLAVLIVVILLGAGVAYAYFATDAFKTEKEMFFSYIEKDDIWKELEDEKITEYVEKQKNTAYTNKGEVTLNISGLEDESLDILNQSKITFEGKKDTSKKMSEQNLTLDFAQGFNIPIQFRQDGETYGIQSDFIDSKFVAIRNENLKALVEKLGMESYDIPDKIEFENKEFTEQELKTLKERYNKILDDNLEEELFTKEKVEKQTVITLSMTEEKFVSILKQILETIRNDEIILSKLPDGIEVTDIQEQIDEMISEITSEETSTANKFEVKLYVEAKDIKKCEILFLESDKVAGSILIENTANQITMKIYEENKLIGELSITKETNQNDVSYKIAMKIQDEEQEVEFNFTAQYKNVLTLDNVEEIYNIKMSANGENNYIDTIGNNIDISINYSNLKTFSPDVQIEGFNENNSIILNDATEEQLQNLIVNVYQKMGLM